MSSTEKNSEVVVENVEAEEKASGEAKELKGTKRPAEDKVAETKKAKKEENGAADDEEIIEEEELEHEEDEEYDLPYGEEDDMDGEEEEEEVEGEEEEEEIDEDDA